ncbi:MAG: DUF3084 domain-containing protein [Prochlorotrichaceae cyanobacterium]|jgi:uncharacterized protein (DUF3084 family)
MAGYLLIISVLLLGGVIATVGDRLGYKVGKARLSWFNLRPRDTAVLITILTGGCISATTLGILFAASDSLRTGVFELEKIQNRLTDARTDLEAAQAEKERIEEERDQARRDRVAAQNRLNEINQFLKEAQAEQQATAEVLDDVVGKADRLRSEVERLEGDRRELVQQRDQVRQQIQERDRELQQQETVIAEGTVRLQDLEAQQRFLDEAIVDLEQDLLLLRERRVVLARGEVLAAQLLQVNTRSEAEERVDLLLRQANQVAQRKTLPGTGAENDVVIQIPQAEVDRLIETLSDGQPYVVRVLSAGNYITGESSVLVFTDVSLNRVIFPAGQVIASTAIDPTSINTSELRDRLNLLLSAAQFRSRQAGIVNDNIEIPIESLVGFLTQVSLYDRPLVIQAIASEPAYTVGPLRLAFLALENDQIIFRSNPAPPPRL